MKRYLSLLIILMCVFFIGCKNESKYQIIYDLDGGVCNNLINEFDDSKEIILPTPTKEGFNFIGWYQNDIEVKSLENKNYYLVAKWEIKMFNITYDLNGGTADNLVTEFTYLDKVMLPIPIKEGSKFLGWYQGNEKVEEIELKNYSLVAHYEVIIPSGFNVKIYYQGKIVFDEVVAEGTKISEIDFLSKLDSNYLYQLDEAYTDKDFSNSISLRSKIIEDTELYLSLEVKPIKEDYKNLKISILGDSISTFYSSSSEVNSYYSGNDEFYYPKYCSVISSYTKTWWWKTIESLESSIGINNSWSGTCVYNWGNETNSSAMNMHRIKTLDENGTPDIIIINLGTNDAVNNFSDSIFKNAYDTMLTRIKKEYPNAYLFCFNLGYSVYDGYNPVRLRYNKIIEEVTNKHMAVLVDIAYIQTVDTYQEILADRLHPNEEGMNRISNRAVSTIKGFFNSGKKFK